MSYPTVAIVCTILLVHSTSAWGTIAAAIGATLGVVGTCRDDIRLRRLAAEQDAERPLVWRPYP